MNKIALNQKHDDLYMGVTQEVCTCYFCGICLACIIFLPLIALELAAAVGGGLTIEKSR